MVRDLRDIVNKIIVVVSENDPSPDEVGALAADLGTFFDATVDLVYLGKLPPVFPTSQVEGGAGQLVAASANVVEETGEKLLARMAEAMAGSGITVNSMVVIGAGSHSIQQVIEKQQADLVVLPNWETGVTSRLSRVVSPSVLEDATCPVLVLKGSRWLTKIREAGPGGAKTDG